MNDPFKVGEFVQHVGSPTVYKVTRAIWSDRVTSWFYDVEGENLSFKSVVMSRDSYRVVPDPNVTANLTTEQLAILRDATQLLYDLEQFVPRTTVHYVVESLKADLRKLTTPGGGGKPFHRAWVGHVKTSDVPERTDIRAPKSKES